MKEITPKNLRCGWGSCPALYEVTPADMKCSSALCPAVFEEVTPACAIGATCPALYEQEDGVLIIGKRVAIPDAIKDRVGDDEDVLWVPKNLLKDIEWKE